MRECRTQTFHPVFPHPEVHVSGAVQVSFAFHVSHQLLFETHVTFWDPLSSAPGLHCIEASAHSLFGTTLQRRAEEFKTPPRLAPRSLRVALRPPRAAPRSLWAVLMPPRVEPGELSQTHFWAAPRAPRLTTSRLPLGTDPDCTWSHRGPTVCVALGHEFNVTC